MLPHYDGPPVRYPDREHDQISCTTVDQDLNDILDTAYLSNVQRIYLMYPLKCLMLPILLTSQATLTQLKHLSPNQKQLTRYSVKESV